MNNFGDGKCGPIRVDPQVPLELSDWLFLVASDRDKHAFTQLFKFFAPKIRRFGVKKLNDEAMANELVQETMASVWKKAHLYNPSKGAATTWVYTVMRNTCFDMLRKSSSNPTLLADDIWPVEGSCTEAAIQDEDFKDHLMNKAVLQHIERLSRAQQTIVKGIYFQDLSQEQLAKQLNIPIGTVKSRLRLALKHLQQQMGGLRHD
nr:sigma-70 family RNA polymerase sigma factor [Vibrio profundi]